MSALTFVFLLISSTLVAQDMPPAKVRVEKVVSVTSAQTQTLVGLLSFERTVRLASERSGVVLTQAIEPGKMVKSGEGLAYLDSELLGHDIDILENQAKELESRLKAQRIEVERLRGLLKQAATSQQSYDQAFFSEQSLAAGYLAIMSRVSRVQTEIRKGKISALEDSLVLRRLILAGEYLPEGGQVAELGVLSSLVVEVMVPENLAYLLQAGHHYPVFIPALNSRIEGKLFRVLPVADQATRSVPVQISIPFQEHMAVNMTALAMLPVGADTDHLLVPRAAVLQGMMGVGVYQAIDGKAAFRPVTVIGYRDRYCLLSGDALNPEFPVIVEGNERLAPDRALEVLP